MAEGQRRPEGQAGFGANFLSALTGTTIAEIQRRRQTEVERRLALEKIFAEALAKEQFNPEAQARLQAGELINRLNPEPKLTMALTASPEQRAQMGQRLEEARRSRSQRVLDAMQQHGLLPKAPLDLRDVFAKSEAQAGGRIAGELSALGATSGAPGTLETPAGPLEMTSRRIGGATFEPPAEEVGRREAIITAAREQSKALTAEKVEFKNVKAAFDTAGALLANIPAPDSQVVGFTTSQLRNRLTKLGFEQDLNEYNTFVKSILGQMAKVISREGGRLTDQDIDRVAEILNQLPFLNDTGRTKRKRTLNTVVALKGFDLVFPEAGVWNVQQLGKERIVSFSTVEEAEDAGLPKGTKVLIGNRSAVVE